MISWTIDYLKRYKSDGRYWILCVKLDDLFTYQYKFVTKPKGKLLRKYISMGIRNVKFDKYWDEV